jgi:hypothetical protein
VPHFYSTTRQVGRRAFIQNENIGLEKPSLEVRFPKIADSPDELAVFGAKAAPVALVAEPNAGKQRRQMFTAKMADSRNVDSGKRAEKPEALSYQTNFAWSQRWSLSAGIIPRVLCAPYVQAQSFAPTAPVRAL